MNSSDHAWDRREFLKGAGAALLLGALAPRSLWATTSGALQPRAAQRTSRVGPDGVLRWSDTGEEVALFGVNYCVPCASAYRMLEAVNVSPFAAIDMDIPHFVRLGLDAIRLSFWGDWENSDAEGNLVDNEHLQLLDYLIDRAKRAGIYMLLSPIVTYDASWPDAMDRPRAGFSSVYKKAELGLNPSAIAAQVNYLQQVLRHKNRYTGVAYKDEPAILAVEPINEPYHHPDKLRESIQYIDTLADAVRRTGCTKPIFYNVTENMKIAGAVQASSVDGATFGWYPTGLVSGHTLTGNFLPRVDDYPQMRDPRLAKKAKLVYEFDAPDLLYSYMYPAMARTFRAGGVQFATMFTYDSLPIAAGNLEFQTHYLNLAYTPHKALSLMIAAEVFRQIPRGREFGRFPRNMSFGPFRVDDRSDLSEMVTPREFLYSNDTTTAPQDPSQLARLAGCGSSPVVSYDGTGAYFLDRLEAGMWRLEVYPDAALIADPFARQRIGRDAAVVLTRERNLRISLPDLGGSFQVEGAAKSAQAAEGAVSLTPGVYLLRRSSVAPGIALDRTCVAPPQTVKQIAVRHTVPPGLIAGRTWHCIATVVGPEEPSEVRLFLQPAGEWKFHELPMKFRRAAEYECRVSPEFLREGLLRYAIVVRTSAGVLTFPQNMASVPGDWDFPAAGFWELMVQAGDDPVVLFDASRDRNQILFAAESYKHISFVPGRTPAETAIRLARPESEHEEVCCQSSVTALLDQIGAKAEIRSLKLQARSLRQPGACGVLLIERDGSAWGARVPLASEWAEVSIPLSTLSLQKAAVIPRGFPYDATPYWSTIPGHRGGAGDSFNPQALQAVQIAVAARFSGTNAAVECELQSVELG